MMRIVVFLIAVGIVAGGIAWLADRPGEVSITWLGWRIETSVLVAAFAVAALTAVLALVWSVMRGVVRAPDTVTTFLRRWRGEKGYRAISRGLVAVGTGDVRAARKFAQEARRFAPGEPLSLLLGAQTAQLSGDRTAAERAFAEMAQRPDTKLLGLRGLFIEARRRDDIIAARAYAEEAAKSGPSPAWAGQAVLEFRSTAGDWTGALAALEKNMRSGLLDRQTYKRQRAVLLTAQAQRAEATDRDNAKELALEAAKLAPTLVPAAALAGRFLAEAGELRKASRILNRAWAANPHPDLAETFAHLRFGDSARDRLARVDLLVKRAPGNIEGALALACAALGAREFAKARAALLPFLAQPTQRVALVMAQIDEVEYGDSGRAREWMARAVHAARDPVWTADGFISDRWLPVSPVSGRLDAFQWKVPLAELASADGAHERAGTALPIIEARPAEAAMPAKGIVAADKEIAEAVPEAAAPESAPAASTPGVRPARAPRVEPVIPLLHVPDDPGPESEPEPEPIPEPPPDRWDRLRQFLK